MARVLTSVTIGDTECNNLGGVRSCWAGLGDTVADAVCEVDVGAEAESVRLAVLGWAAESRGCRKHVVDTDLLRNGLINVWVVDQG
jgi:hypothetical protein